MRSSLFLVDFDVDNVWKYDINNGDRFGTGWETVSYDDSTWPSGASGLGLDAAANGVPIRTTLPYAANSVPTYFRRHFFLPSATNGVVLTLRDVVEDGAVYYINGQEAFRHNVSAGALTFATRTTVAQADPTPIQGPFDIPATNLVSGDNVIAVVVIQSGATSSDVELAVELQATIDAFGITCPGITSEPNNVSIVQCVSNSATFSISATGSVSGYQWFRNGTAIPGANGPTYTLNPAGIGDNGAQFRAIVTNANCGATSTVATLTVMPDTTPPSVLYAVGYASPTNSSLTNITIVFSEPIDTNDPA